MGGITARLDHPTLRVLASSLADDKIAGLLSFGLPFFVYCFTLNSAGGQAQNIVSMQSSLIQQHSLSVFPPGMDMIQFGGKFYNVYAPGLAFFSFPFAIFGFVTYWALFGYVGNALLMDEIFLALCGALSGFLVFKTSRLFTKLSYASLLASISLTLGTGVWPFAVSVFPHDASLLFSVLSVYLTLKYCKDPSGSPYFPLVAGLSLGAATLVEYAAGLFVLPLALYLTVENRRVARSLLSAPIVSFAGVFALVGIGLNLFYNYSIFGNPLTFPQQLSAAGVHFLLNGSLLEHVIYYLVSPFRGVFVLCPILVLGLFGLWEMWKLYRSDSILFAALFTGTLIYYSAWQGWDGAWAYGPRFLIIGLPYLAVPISILLSQRREWYRLFLGLFIVSSFIQGIGAVAGASAPGRYDPLVFQPLSYALPQLLSGNTLVVWMQGIGYVAAIVGIFSLFFIMWLIASKIVGSAEKKFGFLESEKQIKIPIENNN